MADRADVNPDSYDSSFPGDREPKDYRVDYQGAFAIGLSEAMGWELGIIAADYPHEVNDDDFYPVPLKVVCVPSKDLIADVDGVRSLEDEIQNVRFAPEDGRPAFVSFRSVYDSDVKEIFGNRDGVITDEEIRVAREFVESQKEVWALPPNTQVIEGSFATRSWDFAAPKWLVESPRRRR